MASMVLAADVRMAESWSPPVGVGLVSAQAETRTRVSRSVMLTKYFFKPSSIQVNGQHWTSLFVISQVASATPGCYGWRQDILGKKPGSCQEPGHECSQKSTTDNNCPEECFELEFISA